MRHTGVLVLWPWKIVVISNVSPGHLLRREILIREPELLDSGHLYFGGTAAGFGLLQLRSLSPWNARWQMDFESVLLYKAIDEVHNSFDLVSYSTPRHLNRFLSFLFTVLDMRIYCRGQRVIVHIMPRTVVSIHTSFPHMVRGYVKYTCSHEIYMAMVCIQSTQLQPEFTHFLLKRKDNICDCILLFHLISWQRYKNKCLRQQYILTFCLGWKVW